MVKPHFEALLASVVESSNDAIISKTLDGIVTSWNPAAERLFGYTAEEMIGRSIALLSVPGQEEDYLAILDRVRRGERVAHFETRRLTKDGRVLDISLTVSPIRDERGTIIGASKIARDVTEKKRVEAEVSHLNEELKRRIQELRTVLDTAPVGIAVSRDRGCRFISSNETLARMLGVVKEANISKSPSASDPAGYRVFADGRELGARELPMQRAAAENVEVEEKVLEIVREDGSRATILMNAKPIRDELGAVTGAVGACVDITRLRAAEEALRDMNRRKDEFLAMLAHELRNPLAAVSNAVQVLKISSNPEHANFARNVIERHTQQLARMIDDLLDVSRITSGKIHLRRLICDAGAILRRAVESVAHLIDDRKHRLICDFEEGRLTLCADPTRVEQIVVNLLTNAAKYTPSGGEIRLRARREGSRVVLSVEDNGVGIPPEKVPQMFELFAQGDRSIARSEGGLGIGLTIVQTLAELHGGSVMARSEGVGRGSTFVVSLPATDRPLPQARPDEMRLDAGRRGARILVVDDSVDTARGMVRLLKLLGNDVHTAHDGPSAIDAALTFKPEFIFLDIGLPVMDGYEVARRLRDVPSCRSSVIVAVTGYGQEEDRRRSREAGIDHHLVKPVDLTKITAILATA